MERKFNIAIVDDHVGIREGFRTILYRIPYIGHVGVFSSSSELKAGMAEICYELILLDIRLKNENGLDICKRLKSDKKFQSKILMLSSYHSDSFILNAYQNRADGYLFKDADTKDIRNAIDSVLIENKSYYDMESLKLIFNQNNLIIESEIETKPGLTEIELLVSKYICSGKTNKEIGSILNLETTTINTHRYRIWKKLGIHKTADLINLMAQNDLNRQKEFEE